MSKSSEILKLCKQPIPEGWKSRITGAGWSKSIDVYRVVYRPEISVRLLENYDPNYHSPDENPRHGGYPPKSLEEVAAEIDKALVAYYAKEALKKKAVEDLAERRRQEAAARRPDYEKLCRLLGTQASDPDCLRVAGFGVDVHLQEGKLGRRFQIEIHAWLTAETPEEAAIAIRDWLTQALNGE
jgi:hypothetical protein